MTLEQYRKEVNPCYGCGCYDSDMGCSMPSVDRSYACPLEWANTLAEEMYNWSRDMDFIDYADHKTEEINKLKEELERAKEMGLHTLLNAIEIICLYSR